MLNYLKSLVKTYVNKTTKIKNKSINCYIESLIHLVLLRFAILEK
jgi:hypothetical protein